MNRFTYNALLSGLFFLSIFINTAAQDNKMAAMGEKAAFNFLKENINGNNLFDFLEAFPSSKKIKWISKKHEAAIKQFVYQSENLNDYLVLQKAINSSLWEQSEFTPAMKQQIVNRIDELAYKKAHSIGSVDSYNNYINGVYVKNQVKQRSYKNDAYNSIDNILYSKASPSDRDALDHYWNYINSESVYEKQYIEAAFSNINSIAFQRAKKANSIEKYDEYIDYANDSIRKHDQWPRHTNTENEVDRDIAYAEKRIKQINRNIFAAGVLETSRQRYHSLRDDYKFSQGALPGDSAGELMVRAEYDITSSGHKKISPKKIKFITDSLVLVTIGNNDSKYWVFIKLNDFDVKSVRTGPDVTFDRFFMREVEGWDLGQQDVILAKYKRRKAPDNYKGKDRWYHGCEYIRLSKDMDLKYDFFEKMEGEFYLLQNHCRMEMRAYRNYGNYVPIIHATEPNIKSKWLKAGISSQTIWVFDDPKYNYVYYLPSGGNVYGQYKDDFVESFTSLHMSPLKSGGKIKYQAKQSRNNKYMLRFYSSNKIMINETDASNEFYFLKSIDNLASYVGTNKCDGYNSRPLKSFADMIPYKIFEYDSLQYLVNDEGIYDSFIDSPDSFYDVHDKRYMQGNSNFYEVILSLNSSGNATERIILVKDLNNDSHPEFVTLYNNKIRLYSVSDL